MAGLQFRGTPFVVAALMSAAAMLFIPDAIHDQRLTAGPGPAASGLPAAADASPSPIYTPTAAAPTAPAASATVPAAPPPLAAPAGAHSLRPGPVSLTVTGFWSWGLLDRRTGQISGSANLTARSDTASMIKVWIAADYLRRTSKPSADALRKLSTMIRDSNNAVASEYHRINGGSASIGRMVSTCGLTESRAVAVGSWSTTEVSARDGARLGLCLADGRAAGPQWTGWLLNEMRQVRGAGRFGIISAFAPEAAARIAIKNGWINRKDGKWHIACLGVADEWTLTVLTVYPLRLGMAYGANVCKQVAMQLAA